MKKYEYIRIGIDMGDLSELNALSGTGWKIVAVVNNPYFHRDDRVFDAISHYALLERELP